MWIKYQTINNIIITKWDNIHIDFNGKIIGFNI